MDDNFNDYFEKDQVEPTVNEHVETEQERQDRELSEATIERRHDTVRVLLFSGIALLSVVLLGWLWARYLHPCRTWQEPGYIMQVSSEGSLLHTIECRMLGRRMVEDTLAYERPLRFTILDDTLAAVAKSLEGTGKCVRVSLEEYRGTLPWRGPSGVIATAIVTDTARFDTTHIVQHRRYK